VNSTPRKFSREEWSCIIAVHLSSKDTKGDATDREHLRVSRRCVIVSGTNPHEQTIPHPVGKTARTCPTGIRKKEKEYRRRHSLVLIMRREIKNLGRGKRKKCRGGSFRSQRVFGATDRQCRGTEGFDRRG